MNMFMFRLFAPIQADAASTLQQLEKKQRQQSNLGSVSGAGLDEQDLDWDSGELESPVNSEDYHEP